jgi:hypothetical protein
MNKTYLGDGVYADFDGFAVVLTTENGMEVTNTIVLEPDVIWALDQFVQKLRGEGGAPNVSKEEEVV